MIAASLLSVPCYAVRVQPIAQDGVVNQMYGTDEQEMQLYRAVSQAVSEGKRHWTIPLRHQSKIGIPSSNCAVRQFIRCVGTIRKVFWITTPISCIIMIKTAITGLCLSLAI